MIAVVCFGYPLQLLSLSLLWYYYERRHPWKSRGIAVGYEPDDKWVSKETEDEGEDEMEKKGKVTTKFYLLILSL